MFPILFLAPFLQLILFGYAATFDIRDIPVGIFSMEQDFYSRRFIDMLRTTGDFVIQLNADSYRNLENAIFDGSVKLGIVIPHDFSRKIRGGNRTEVQLILDGSDSNSSIILGNYIKLVVQRLNEEITSLLPVWRTNRGSVMVAHQPPDIRVRVLYNPELKSSKFMVPGVIVMILLITTALLTAMSIVKEKELGTMELLIVTPLKPFEIVIGKLLIFVLIGFVEVMIVLTAATFIFGVLPKGSILLLFALSGIFLLTTLGLGMLISSITSTQQQAMTVAFFIIMPMVLLSGFIYPIENMPEIIQYITYLLPLRYFLVITRGIILKGAGLNVLWDEAVLLALLGLFFITAGVLNFRKRLA